MLGGLNSLNTFTSMYTFRIFQTCIQEVTGSFLDRRYPFLKFYITFLLNPTQMPGQIKTGHAFSVLIHISSVRCNMICTERRAVKQQTLTRRVFLRLYTQTTSSHR